MRYSDLHTDEEKEADAAVHAASKRLREAKNALGAAKAKRFPAREALEAARRDFAAATKPMLFDAKRNLEAAAAALRSVEESIPKLDADWHRALEDMEEPRARMREVRVAKNAVLEQIANERAAAAQDSEAMARRNGRGFDFPVFRLAEATRTAFEFLKGLAAPVDAKPQRLASGAGEASAEQDH